MIRKITFLICILSFFTCFQNGFAQEDQEGRRTVTLNEAIRGSIDYSIGNIPQGARVVIVNTNRLADNKNLFELSDEILLEMMGSFGQRFNMLGRRNIEALQREFNLQIPDGEVGRDIAQLIGQQMDAEVVVLVSVRLREIRNIYRVLVRAVDVKTGQRLGTSAYSANMDKTNIDRQFFKVDPSKKSKDNIVKRYFNFGKRYTQKFSMPLFIVLPKPSIEHDGDHASYRLDWGFRGSFLPFTSVGISPGISWYDLNDDLLLENNVRWFGAATTMGFLIPVNKKVNLFADGLLEVGGGNDSGVHFGYSVGVSIMFTSGWGMEINHKGIWYDKKTIRTLGLGLVHVW